MPGRIALLRKDGVYEIKLILITKDKVDLDLIWPSGLRARFAGYTLNGFMKYIEV